MAKSNLKVVMGTMTFGVPTNKDSRVTDLKDVKAILDCFQKHGHDEVDTARAYTGGTSEEFLGVVGWQERGLRVQTKIYPGGSIRHTPESIREHLDKSLKALKATKLDIYYLHAPDRSVSWEVTFKFMYDLYKEGKFERLGISNYMAWEVAEIVMLCRTNNWVQPTVYQGLYNAIHRAVEPELFPCLRKFGISFYEYNPLGGGFFTGRYKRVDSAPEAGSRFDDNKGTTQATNYRKRYWNEEYFKALGVVEAAAAKHGITPGEAALRWLNHHSLMSREYGDAIIIGASSLRHIEENLTQLEKGPLSEDVVAAIDEAWGIVRPAVTKYWH